MEKWPTGTVYVCNILCYPIYLSDLFARGLEVHVKKISTSPTLRLSMLYRDFKLLLLLVVVSTYFFAVCQGSWTSAAPSLRGV